MQHPVESPALWRLYTSPIGKKLITGLTGLGLATFAIAHVIGNLLMFVSHDAYNAYAYQLERLGPLFWAVELIIAGVFLLHAVTGVYLFWSRLQARPQGYATYASRGEPSLQSPSSRTMIATGLVLGSFLVIHLLNFKFGTWYTTLLRGQEVRDLARLVVEKFQRPLYAFGYTAIVALLGLHLRHGIWSALQSLGVMAKSFRPLVYGASLVLAVAIAIGFLILPIAIYFHLVT